ncbi:hypothetical protein K505DRAFT_329704 [Melanomma pulvis-pyrius CBS 109.77]|uniref:Uncharacterized protein n=1 Tax=Melanomma pulvis-pyrius CBS 109.77 TaxID=1314802 RepID=A0A6A6WU06_9PLEO|nr:hypothetical protein K505DRAFT_329704 [Melanomma pulvis-pyrius CBS 109.77]
MASSAAASSQLAGLVHGRQRAGEGARRVLSGSTAAALIKALAGSSSGRATGARRRRLNRRRRAPTPPPPALPLLLPPSPGSLVFVAARARGVQSRPLLCRHRPLRGIFSSPTHAAKPPNTRLHHALKPASRTSEPSLHTATTS